MKLIPAIIALACISRVALGESDPPARLDIALQVQGTNVTYVLADKGVSRDTLFQQLHKVHRLKPSPRTHVVIWIEPDIPVGFVRQFEQEVGAIGFFRVDCVLLANGEMPQSMTFSPSEIERTVYPSRPPSLTD